MVVGIALSGGGITGMLASMCALNSLDTTFDLAASGLSLSSVSGGSLGYGIFANAGQRLYFPTYDASASYNKMKSSMTSGDDDSLWFGNGNNYIPSWGGSSSSSSSDANATETSSAAAAGHRAGGDGNAASPERATAAAARGVRLPDDENAGGWWVDAINTMFYVGYGVHDYDIVGGPHEWYVENALFRAKKCPISLHSSGVMKDADKGLSPLWVEMTSLAQTSPKGYALKDDVTRLDAISYSSAFWAASIVESSAQYLLLSSTLYSTEATSGDDDWFYTPACPVGCVREGGERHALM